MLSQDQRLLKVKTPMETNTLVIRGLSGSEFISSPFRFSLDLLAEEGTKVDLKALLGKAVSVSMMDGEATRYFHGIVSTAASGSRDERFRHCHAEVVPWLWLLTLKTSNRIFQDKTVVQILHAIFDELKKDFPLVNYRDATTGDHIALDYCLQYRETDFNFISRLMEQEGIFYFFEHSENKHTLVFADANAAIAKCSGQSQIVYREGGIAEGEGNISHWQQDWAELSGKYSLRDHHFQLPSKPLEVSDHAQDTNTGGLEFYDYPGEFTARFNRPEQRLDRVEKEGEKRIRTRMEQELVEETVSFGRSTRRNLAAGYKFSLSKHFSCDGDYILTEVHHSVTQSPDYVSGMASDAPYRNTFTCVPAAVHLRPRRQTCKPLVSGPQTAVVAVKAGEESWLDKFGRVRIQFHWDREGKDNETSACWVRVAQKWAGTGWGAHFWPRIGQELVVEFLEGDPDRPLVTGSVYNLANMPPYGLPDNYTRSGIVTASSRYNSSTNFNELRFEDKTGHEQIFINAERDMDWRVEHEHREFVGNNRDLVVKAAQTELIEANKHEHVKSEHVEKIGGNASREVDAGSKEKIAGKLSLTVSGAAHQKIGNVYTLAASEIHLKSNQKIVIDSLRTSIKGPGGFVDVGPSGVAIQGVMVNINSGGSAGMGSAASPDAPAAPKAAQIAADVTVRVGGGNSSRPGLQISHEQYVAQRMAELAKAPGHGPQRHEGQVTSRQLEKRAMEQIDPVTGTKYDAYRKMVDGSPAKHKCGRDATKVNTPEAYVKAEDYIRSSVDFMRKKSEAESNSNDKLDLKVPLVDIFGKNYESQVSGKSRLGSSKKPLGTVDTNFANGNMTAVYKKDTSGNWKLVTMFPEAHPAWVPR